MRIHLNTDQLTTAEVHLRTQAFRGLLQALGYPARLHRLKCDAVQAVIDSLLDNGTTVAIWDPKWRSQVLATGAVTSEPAEWVFAAPGLIDLSGVYAGTHDMPEGGASVILPVTALSDTCGALQIRATGSGISATQDLFVTGLSAGVIRDHISFRSDYPRGVDLVLCAGPTVTALPRYLTLEVI